MIYVRVNRDVGAPAAPPGSVVDASGWANRDLLIAQGDIRPATPEEIAALTAERLPAPPPPAPETAPRGRRP